jgi:hypothetical protein
MGWLLVQHRESLPGRDEGPDGLEPRRAVTDQGLKPALGEQGEEVTARLPEESLLLSLTQTAGNGPASVRGIGDAWAPGTIAAAVWSGRRYAEEFDATPQCNDHVPFRREVTGLATLPLIDSTGGT